MKTTTDIFGETKYEIVNENNEGSFSCHNNCKECLSCEFGYTSMEIMGVLDDI